MAVANLFHSLRWRKAAQTQQHTGVVILETVSSRETVFQLRSKVRGMKQFVSFDGRLVSSVV
jgi:hypothetical protein